MYRCENCKSVIGPGKKVNRVVVETRPKSYAVFKMVPARRQDRTGPREHVSTASGHEIAREIAACATCARELRQEHSGADLQSAGMASAAAAR